LENFFSHFNCVKPRIGNTNFKIFFFDDQVFDSDTWNSEPHFHSFCECHFIKEGKVLLKTKNQDIFLTENRLCILPPQAMHSVQTLTTPLTKTSFYVVFSENKDNKSDTFSLFQHIFAAQTPIIYDAKDTHLNQISELIKTQAVTDFLFEIKLHHLFALVLVDLLENLSNIEIQNHSKTFIQYEDQLKLKIELFMTDNFSVDAQLNDLAEYLYLSPRQTSRLLKNYYNQSFLEFKNANRIEAAKKLMTDPAYSLKTIAETVGYHNYSGFFKAFRSCTGVSPEEYRLSIKQL